MRGQRVPGEGARVASGYRPGRGQPIAGTRARSHRGQGQWSAGYRSTLSGYPQRTRRASPVRSPKADASPAFKHQIRPRASLPTDAGIQGAASHLQPLSQFGGFDRARGQGLAVRLSHGSGAGRWWFSGHRSDRSGRPQGLQASHAVSEGGQLFGQIGASRGGGGRFSGQGGADQPIPHAQAVGRCLGSPMAGDPGGHLQVDLLQCHGYPAGTREGTGGSRGGPGRSAVPNSATPGRARPATTGAAAEGHRGSDHASAQPIA